jgi:NAD(P)-dependent dehydrogenase (short-subunit alcohol dehydrogenase family)
MEFEGKVAVITGGASGIGRSIALALAKHGVDIAVADIDDARLEAVCQEIEQLGRRAFSVHCDVSRDADVENLASQVLSNMEKVDILVNNAGKGMYVSVENIKLDHYKFVLDINVLGIIRGVLAFLPHMLKRGSGYIINTASAAGLSGGLEPYPLSKYAAVGYSEGLFSYLRPKGIMVSVLCPGITNTNLIFNSPVLGNEQEIQKIKLKLEQRFTAPDAVKPEEVADEVIRSMEENRFFILPPGTESYLSNAMQRGRDIQKLEEYLLSVSKSAGDEKVVQNGLFNK